MIKAIEIVYLYKMCKEWREDWITELNSLHDGFQVIIFDKEHKQLNDAVCHNFSYGHENGLLETWDCTKSEDNDVVGYLTAAEIFNMWNEAY